MNLREFDDVLSFKKAPPLVKNFIGSLYSAKHGDIKSGISKRFLQKEALRDTPLDGMPPLKNVVPSGGVYRNYRLFRNFTGRRTSLLLILLINEVEMKG
jgi:hypothetical protein